MTWFRRGRDSDPGSVAARVPSQPPTVDEDSPTALRARLFELTHYINAHAGRLPVEAVVTARRVTDTLREIIDTSDVRPLDIYAVLSVKGILTDYLPTTLQRFVALDEDVRQVARPSGRTPEQSLQEQLDALWDASLQVLLAVQAQDADALLTQGTFLRTKFTRSDLDL
jgi:hypothetical protein